jgi:hypothetical protein
MNDFQLLTILSTNNFNKQASVKDLAPGIAAYFSSKINPNDQAGSILNELAPGAIWVAMSAMGLGKWGALAGLLLNVFHVDVKGFLTNIYNEVKPLVADGKKTTSAEVDNIVNEVSKKYSHGKFSSLELAQEAELLKIAIIDFERHNLKLGHTKFAFFGSEEKKITILGKLFGLIMKVGLASAGLMVAGDVINSLFHRPNSLDHTFQAGTTPQTTLIDSPAIIPTSTQTKYKPKPEQPLPSNVKINNTQSNIENMIIQFAKDSYSGLYDKDNLIKNSSKFKYLVESIVFYNSSNKGYSVVLIPPYWKTKKEMVDNFIDGVAANDQV